MVDPNLSEIDGWLSLSFDDFARRVMQEFGRRFLGITVHCDMLAMALADQSSDRGDVLKQMKTTTMEGHSAFKDDVQARWKQLQGERPAASSEARIAFLGLMITTATPFVNEIDRLVTSIPASRRPEIISAVRNIEHKNLVQLDQLLRVCRIYTEKLRTGEG